MGCNNSSQAQAPGQNKNAPTENKPVSIPDSGKPQLIYFDGRGRGEFARYVFAQAAVDYDDVRIQFSEWPALKESKWFYIIMGFKLLK